MKKFYEAKKIYDIMMLILEKIGLKEEDRNIIASCYIEADLAGVKTHGVNIFPTHVEKFENKVYNVNPNLKIIRETDNFKVLDGDEAIGPVSAYKTMKIAVDKARTTGVFTCFLRNTNTIGPAFFYNNIAIEDEMIGITLSNSPAAMAPTNGKQKLIGTNPLAISIPAGQENPIIYDIATSEVAKSKIKQALIENKQIPIGWAIDKEGNPTQDPEKALNGLILPMAGYKGYGLAMCIDILTGLISGGAYLDKVGKFYGNDKCMNIGATFIAINPKLIFGEDFYKNIDEYIKTIKQSEVIDKNVPISIPGENRMKNKIINEQKGIELNVETIQRLKAYIKYYNINAKL